MPIIIKIESRDDYDIKAKNRTVDLYRLPGWKD
jgi:hypothetical protein